jgi:hypothetical protein
MTTRKCQPHNLKSTLHIFILNGLQTGERREKDCSMCFGCIWRLAESNCSYMNNEYKKNILNFFGLFLGKGERYILIMYN